MKVWVVVGMYWHGVDANYPQCYGVFESESAAEEEVSLRSKSPNVTGVYCDAHEVEVQNAP